MAVIGKIREKSSWVIGIIGLAMLGFIATDLLSNRFLFSGGGGAPKGVGKIYGDYVDYQFFKERLDPAIRNQQQQNKGELSVAQQNQINDQIWQELVEEKILDKEASVLGLDVTGEEIYDLCIGPNPDQIAVQYLSDPKTHQINRPMIKKFIEDIDNAKPEQQEFWHSFETYLTNDRLKAKYRGLVKAGVYVSDLEMQDDYVSRNKTAAIQFVPLFLNSMPDSTVEVSDREIKDYYEAHKEQYKREDSRTFEYVTFDVRPSKLDSENTKKSVIALIPSFKSTKDDSSFVVTNGKGTYSNQFQGRGSFGENTYLSKIEDSIFKYKKDSDIIGPYYEDGSWKVAKIVDHKEDSVYWMHASHILKAVPRGSTSKTDSIEAYNKAKKVYDDVRKPGADFAKLAQEQSDDPSSSKGGDLGWFKEGAMVKTFNDAVKNHQKGDIVLVSSQFGTHVIKITDEKTKKLVKVAILDKPIMVGSETNTKAYAQVTGFRTKASDAASFDATAKAMNLTKKVAPNVKPNQHDISGLENPRELIRWAYKDETKEGSVSDPYRLGDKFVVAKLTNIYKEGYAPLDEIKKDIKVLAQHEKKKQILADKLKAAREHSTSLDAIAKEVKSSVSTAEGLTFQNPNIQNLANEPEVVGATFGLKTNEVSQPIKGENGVFIIKVTSMNEVKPPVNYDKDRKMMIDQQKQGVEGESKEALRKKADVKDYRYFYF
jgi:peptidyl-prolyl cis-trans isomerase D